MESEPQAPHWDGVWVWRLFYYTRQSGWAPPAAQYIIRDLNERKKRYYTKSQTQNSNLGINLLPPSSMLFSLQPNPSSAMMLHYNLLNKKSFYGSLNSSLNGKLHLKCSPFECDWETASQGKVSFSSSCWQDLWYTSRRSLSKESKRANNHK